VSIALLRNNVKHPSLCLHWQTVAREITNSSYEHGGHSRERASSACDTRNLSHTSNNPDCEQLSFAVNTNTACSSLLLF
jgi:hypothetical protein